MEKLKYASELISTTSSSVMAGFNMFINGYPPLTFADKDYDLNLKMHGYDFAKKMAQENGIAFIYPFKCGNSGCYPFKYGGSFVCNGCNNSGVDKEWWKIKVVKDGSAFCCHGLDFDNLQESENYAFGDTFQEAINNYGNLIIKEVA